MRTYKSILDLIGQTPIVRLRTGIPDNVNAYVKLEFFNASGSIKDRMALHIIKKAIDNGTLKKGDTVIDNTSGNTGASIAMVASLFGLNTIMTAAEKTSKEKIDLIKSYGAEVIVTPEVEHHDDPEGCYMVARRLAKENGYFDINQYDNQDNVGAHYISTGPEIWDDTDGKITHFVAGIGTGGTFSGTAKYLKEVNPDIKTIGVDPEGSIFAEYIKNRSISESHAYKIEGIGSDVLTDAFYPDLVDEVITVTDKDAFNRARLISKVEGISGGGSSGAIAFAMEQIASTLGENDLIVGIFADAGIRYLSKCYNDEWMKKFDFL
jgi:cysteine synthase